MWNIANDVDELYKLHSKSERVIIKYIFDKI